MAAGLQALGISPNEALQVQREIAAGVISPQEIQSLCGHLAASNINTAMVESVGGKLGLNSSEVDQIRGCLPGGTTQTSVGNAASFSGVAPVQLSGAVPVPGSLIENSFRQLDLQLAPPYPTPTSLDQFGYSVFAATVSSFAPVTNVPVGPDYVIGPGDQLNIYTWGRINQVISATVDRDGSITVSGIEPLQVGGLTLSQAKNLIEGRMEQTSGLHVHLTMGQLRTIQVLVVGAVSQPGSYTVSPLSKVSNALIAAGGVTKIGSLRRVEMRRGNQVIKQIDYYNLLLRGDNSDDGFLQTNDVVFVPAIGPVVGVIGDVQRPAIYELKTRGETLRQAMRLAAGAGPFSDTDRVQVLRADAKRRLIAVDVDYAREGTSFSLRDGDLVKVFHMQTLHRDTVTLTGNVHRPGEFQWRPDMRVSDLIKLGDGVNLHTYFKYARIDRMIYPSMRQKVVPVDLIKALESSGAGPADLTLEPLDQLDIFNEDSLREAPVVSISGEVLVPGTYPLNPSTQLSDIIYMAGGFKEDADRAKIQLVRTRIVNGGQARFVRMDVDYADKHNGKPVSNPSLETKDEIYVSVASGWHPPWTVTVQGEVMRPGTYPIGRHDNLASVLERCGGFTSNAFPRGLVFSRASVRAAQQQRLNQSVQQLSQGLAEFVMFNQGGGDSGKGQGSALVGLQGLLSQAQTQQASGRMVVRMEDLQQLQTSSNNVLLIDGDSIAIPPRPAAVNVLGSVNEPGSITAQSGWTAGDYLYHAGGPGPFADMKLMMVIKADGSAITQASLDEAHSFPLYSVVSGGLLSLHLEAGDTIYLPPDIETFVKTKYWLDVTSIIANTAQGLAIIALLARNL